MATLRNFITLYILPLFLFVLPLVGCFAPRGLAAYTLVFTFLMAIGAWPSLHELNWRRWLKTHWLPLVGIALMAASTFWSISPRKLEMLRDGSYIALCAIALFTIEPLWPQDIMRRALRWFVLGLAAAIICYALQYAANFPFHHYLYNIAPEVNLRDYNTAKRSEAVFALLMWPGAYYLWLHHRRSWALALLAVITAFLILASSRAAMLGSTMGVIAMLATVRYPQICQKLALCLLPLAFPLALAVAFALPHLPPHVMQALPLSSQYRIEIWKFAADNIIENPLGIGMDGSRTLARTEGVANGRMPEHPHNVFLQIWLEGGWLGAALCMWMAFLLWRHLCALPHQPFVWGYAVTAVITLSVAYGAWQAWWLGAHIMAAILLALCPAERQH